jgi:hypothetical protein
MAFNNLESIHDELFEQLTLDEDIALVGGSMTTTSTTIATGQLTSPDFDVEYDSDWS